MKISKIEEILKNVGRGYLMEIELKNWPSFHSSTLKEDSEITKPLYFYGISIGIADTKEDTYILNFSKIKVDGKPFDRRGRKKMHYPELKLILENYTASDIIDLKKI